MHQDCFGAVLGDKFELGAGLPFYRSGPPAKIGAMAAGTCGHVRSRAHWRLSCKMLRYPALCCHAPVGRAPNRSMSDELSFTGERFIPGVPGEIWYEHWHRYHFAASI